MKPSATLRKQATKDIKELDENISLLRENWMTCSEKNKGKYMKMIDKLLDERLVYMAQRDGK